VSHRFIEQHSIDYVPIAERHGKVWHLWPVWFSGDAHLATVATGVVGIALGGNLCVDGTGRDPRLRLRHVFHGLSFDAGAAARIAADDPVAAAIRLRWALAGLGGRADRLHRIQFASIRFWPRRPCTSLYGGNANATILVFTLLSVSLAVIGYDLIHLAQRWVAYLLIVALLVFTLAVLFRGNLAVQAISLRDFRAIPFLAQFFAAASYQIAWSIYVSDYSRYLPRNVGVSASFWWTYLGAFIGGTWMMLVGTLSAALYPTLEVATALRTAADAVLPGFGKPLLLCSLLSLVTITSLNFYGASLTFLSVMDSMQAEPSDGRQAACSRCSIAADRGTGLALSRRPSISSPSSARSSSVLLYLFTPWTAINLVDFYWVRKGHYSVREIFNPRGMYGRWNWRGLLAYGVGFVAMIPFFSTDHVHGARRSKARRRGSRDAGRLAGVALVYIAACRSLDVEQDRRRAEQADAGLDPPVTVASRSA
jgi:NCS1 family nucleobase:cation symporter-1